MSDVTVTEVSRNFADYINRVAFRRETFTLVRGKKPLAELRPLPAGRRLSDLPDLLASVPHLTEADAADFAADLTSARDELARTEVGDAWES
jgi:antitoxin (DNA-binding transcriptional repressor) of toxin-antitoxin stability system